VVGREGEDLGGWKCFVMGTEAAGDTRGRGRGEGGTVVVLYITVAVVFSVSDAMVMASSRCSWRKLLEDGGVVHEGAISV
jgi:hypothetical protein